MPIPINLYGPQALKDICTSGSHTIGTNNTSVCSRSQMNTTFDEEVNLLPPKWVVTPKAGFSDYYTLFQKRSSLCPVWASMGEACQLMSPGHTQTELSQPLIQGGERACKENMPSLSSHQYYRYQRRIKTQQAIKEKWSHKCSRKINRKKSPWCKHGVYFTRFQLRLSSRNEQIIQPENYTNTKEISIK